MTVKKIHRVLALCVAVFWLVQVLTGVLLTFRQELDKATLPARGAPVSTAALGRRIDALQKAGNQVTSLWVADFAVDMFDLRYVDSDRERLMRVDGAGHNLRDGLENAPFANGGFFRTLTLVHTELLAGDTGKWIVVASGVLLISNLILGLKLAWPRARMWKQALILRSSNNYAVHRTLGLWVAIPLLVAFSAGVALQFDDDMESALGLELQPPASSPAAEAIKLKPAQALEIALARYPGSTLTALNMPTPGHNWYRVRVHAPGEVSRMYGTTTVYLSAANGALLKDYPAAKASFARFLYDALYPLHTGELGGLAGRSLLLGLGVALLVMGTFGVRLWLTRRKPR